MKRAIFLISFFSIQRAGSNSLTSPAIRQLKAAASNWVIGPIPLWPSFTARQVSSVPDPTEDNRPIPVMTTLRDKWGAPWGKLLFGFVLDITNCVLHRTDLLG